MRKRVFLSVLLAMVVSPAAVNAGDAAAGKAKSVTCVGCHGTDGISANPLWPNLAGQHEQYLAKQMRDFRDGKRKDPVMAPMAMALSDTDIDNLAAYYASLK